jgi:hypothetical protein
MTDLDKIRKFEYRPCRISAGFEIDFVVAGELHHGLCRDVSNSGIRATLDGPVAVDSSGLLFLRHPSGVLELGAQVAYTEKREVALVFLFKTPEECERATKYMASIADQADTSQVIRFQNY